MLYILSIANTTPDAIAPALEAAGIAATILDSLGVCAPWPNETGVTVLVSCDDLDAERRGAQVRVFARRWCRTHGEQCAAPTVTPATFELVAATPKPE